MSVADPAGYELAFTEARRALEDQDTSVNELRTRAGVLIAAAAVTTSFFGGAAIADGKLGAAGWVAVGSFLVVGFAVLAILWPRHDWTFSVDAETFIYGYLEPDEEEPLDLPSIHRDLAFHMAASYKRNRAQLRWLFVAFRVGALLLIAEVVAWVVALIAQGS
jgi:hypothetical protein